MLGINDLKRGILFLWKGDPYEVLEADHLKMGRGGAVLQVKIRSLRTRNVLRETFRPSDKFEEAETIKEKMKFIYSHGGKSVFSKADDPSARFSIAEEILGDKKRFLSPKMEVEALKFDEKIINIALPVKVNLIVREAPPGIRGDTSSGGKKTVVLETGAEIDTPLFIQAGDIVRVNTEKGEYVERVKKAE